MAIISSLEKEDVEADVSEIAQEVYEKFEKESGGVPEWVKVMAHRPEILKEFTELFKIIMGPGKIDSYLKWKIAYTVSDALRCPFCLDVTKKMLVKFGADEIMIENIKEKKDIPEQEKEILSLVKDVTDNANVDNPEVFEKLKDKMTEPQIVEVVSVIGLFNYINRFNNTFAILPE
jgi:uncharacterized peroxidase-related enzyme